MNRLERLYELLFARFGPQGWWPGETPLEVTVGAVLAQNTTWRNVSRALDNLREAGLFSFSVLSRLTPAELAPHIRPAGYYNLKAARLLNLLSFVAREHGNLEAFFGLDLTSLRQELLSVKGIGPETADSIILYAAEKPVFVVDAYTQRILFRHGFLCEDDGYGTIQELFTAALPAEVPLYNEFHALFVRLGKEYCLKTKPRCDGCPLQGF